MSGIRCQVALRMAERPTSSNLPESEGICIPCAGSAWFGESFPASMRASIEDKTALLRIDLDNVEQLEGIGSAELTGAYHSIRRCPPTSGGHGRSRLDRGSRSGCRRDGDPGPRADSDAHRCLQTLTSMELFLVGAGISGATAAAETLVDGLAPLKSRFDRMPMLDRRLAGFPAQKHDFFVDAAGKIEQTGVEIFDLDADLIDFLDRFPGTLNMFLHFGASSSDLRNIH